MEVKAPGDINIPGKLSILASQPDEGVLTVADLLRLLVHVSTMSAKQSEEFGPVAVRRLRVPGKDIYVTDELIQASRPQ
jgi:hypothetical protein